VQHHGAPPLYEQIADVGQSWGSADQVGFVVGATQVEALKVVRDRAPDRWLLAPGVGAQGGDLNAALAAGLDREGSRLIVPVSRGVLYADDPRVAAQGLRDEINTARRSPPVRRELVLALFDAGCVRFGEFTLASGQVSPIYVDLRKAISYPDLFKQVVDVYVELVKPLTFDRLAAVPYAALPAAAAVAMRLSRPLIYPRKEAKAYGTAKAVEGVFDPGQVVVAVEDVVTTGGSLLTAIETMLEVGLKVIDVVVLVDRGQGGRERLTEAGCRLHAALTLPAMLQVLQDAGRIDTETYNDVLAYLGS
jgi:uridine monophosphate synthetase